MLPTGWSLIRRCWYEFRMGHSTYLSFLLSLTNFLLISYNFLVAQVPVLKSLFSSIVHFMIVCTLVYVPLAVYVGHWHNCNQLPTDLGVAGEKNPYYQSILEKLDKIEKELYGTGKS
jgi:hypothetical protein